MLNIKLTEEETRDLLNKDYVELERDGVKYVFIYCADTDGYILAEKVIGAYTVTQADIM